MNRALMAAAVAALFGLSNFAPAAAASSAAKKGTPTAVSKQTTGSTTPMTQSVSDSPNDGSQAPYESGLRPRLQTWRPFELSLLTIKSTLMKRAPRGISFTMGQQAECIAVTGYPSSQYPRQSAAATSAPHPSS
ncbi:hypothetical protein [Rhizobium grahamii]|uniref:hypothetical protein n=1 Tax=Rhizobium grahamii TaxID=1120045 RepID=UPI0016762F7C|nr:hypothetical protein [Rhizobium grahamii]